MAVINTNTKALFSQNALKVSGKLQAKSMEQLSTGKRINTAGDDAAGLAISTRMTQQIRALNQAVRNAGDAISLIQTAEGATGEMTNMLQRMRELAIQAINDTNSNPDRSYLDLEFQQLKQEVVRISEMTEWNGFKVLDGTAGERVGEVPVYKATSTNLSGDVLINPTTLRTLGGRDGGEVQTLTFTGTPATGQITVAGHAINIDTTAAANLTAFASTVASALTATSDFDASSGRTVAASAGVLTFTYATADGNVDPVTVLPGSTAVAHAVAVSRDAVSTSTESFTGNAGFIKSGSISIELASATSTAQTVTATFTTADGESITMTGEANRANGTVSFLRSAGNNRLVFSGELNDRLTYSFKDSTNTAEALTNRAVSVSVSVDGSIPALRSGDLRINGIDIGASYATDDLLSPRSNAAGSAIAKAAAINRMAASTGISLPESQTITFAGVPRPGTIRVGGVDVTITSAETTSAAVAAKVAAALRASPLYDLNSGRNISHASGSSVVNVDFSMADGDVGAMEFLPGTSALIGMVDVSQEFTTTAPGTGVYAKVNENIVQGRAMSASSVVSGVVRINGYASADITTVLNNTRESRSRVVEAINAITQRTGVKAIDTGSDAKGITLVAQDGRNIEVTFETTANASIFGDRIGLNQGVQASTISLESKIQTPVVLTSSTTGDITRVGLVEGNFTKNQSVFNTATREVVEAPTAQVTAVSISGTSAATAVYSVSINGVTFSSGAGTASPQTKRDELVAAINLDLDLGVTASKGNGVGELILTANIPGTSYTVTTSAGSNANATISSTEIRANREGQFKPLGIDDLVINGIEIRASRPGDDTKSSTVPQSSDRASSAIAIAAAINSHTPETGVRALANGAISKGMQTTSLLPDTGSTIYTLYVNGTAVDVEFTKDEVGVARRTKVVDAINARMGQHGVTAKDNGYGVSLETDGRNLSVWFDSSIEGLTASEFGLEKGSSTAQVSRIAVGGTVGTETATIMLNGQAITSGAATNTAVSLASSLYTAITAAITADESANPRVLANLSVSYTTGADFLEITSSVPGSPFDLRGASTSGVGPTLTLATVTPNGQGDNDITAIRGATATSNSARTLYGTVRLVSESALMPNLPSPVGAPPSDKAALVGASAKPFTVAVGDRGFGPSGNFAALGFQIGSFGGRSSESLDPPKVGRLAFQVGASANQLITIDLADFGKNGDITGSITGDVDLNVDQRTARIHTRDGANSVLQMLDEAMDKINATRASMGAVMNRLQYAMDNLSNVSMNQEASRSQIQDADYAKASTEMAKSQIMQQAATAVLAQANMSQQTVLQLLQG